MDARKSVIFAFQFIKSILQIITHLIQYTILEIQFWSVKYTTVAVGYAKIWSISILFQEGMQANTIGTLDKNEPLQNSFKRI